MRKSKQTPEFDRQPGDVSGELAASIEAAVKELLKPLSQNDRGALLRRLADLLPEKAAPRAGPVLGKVVDLYQRRRLERGDITVAEAKDAVAAAGIQATPKEVYNAIGYLARKGRIRQIGYSRYQIVDGPALDTLDDFGLEPKEDGE